MKILSFILAILILALNCIPCSDAEAIAVERSHQATNINSVSEHFENTHNDQCSPFCQCSCCAVAYSLSLAPVIEVLVKPGFDSTSFCSYLQHHPKGVSPPIWQPPQLV